MRLALSALRFRWNHAATNAQLSLNRPTSRSEKHKVAGIIIGHRSTCLDTKQFQTWSDELSRYSVTT